MFTLLTNAPCFMIKKKVVQITWNQEEALKKKKATVEFHNK